MGIKKEIFLENLPHKGKFIDWENCVGHMVSGIYDDIRFEFKIKTYNSNEKTMSVEYNGNILNVTCKQIRRCNLGSVFKKITKDFKINIGDNVKDDNRDLIIIDRKYIKNINNNQLKYYNYHCNICSNEDWIVESNLLTLKNGCNRCANQKTVLGINTIWDTDRWMCDLGVSEEDAKSYMKRSNKKIKVECPDCGEIKNIVISKIYDRKSIGCICGDGFSYPEKFLYNILTQLNINFEIQYSPDYLVKKIDNKTSRKYSDFYIPSLSLVIETDGKMGHKGGIVHNQSKKTIEEHVADDEWKDGQHLINGVKTIRINCFESNVEYIKNNILSSELNGIFDISNINWTECDNYAVRNNKVKEVCEWWNNKEEWETTTNGAEKFKIGKSTIVRYLKNGAKIWSCNYDPKEENVKSAKNASKNNSEKLAKKVVLYKDDEYIDEFDSVTELSNVSYELLGVSLQIGNISAVCLGRRKTHKGYTFKYI